MPQGDKHQNKPIPRAGVDGFLGLKRSVGGTYPTTEVTHAGALKIPGCRMPMSLPKFPPRVSAPHVHRAGQGDSEGWALRAEETRQRRWEEGNSWARSSLAPARPSFRAVFVGAGVCSGMEPEH